MQEDGMSNFRQLEDFSTSPELHMGYARNDILTSAVQQTITILLVIQRAEAD